MGKRERYEPGTFCWVDLATTDPAGAIPKSVYSQAKVAIREIIEAMNKKEAEKIIEAFGR